MIIINELRKLEWELRHFRFIAFSKVQANKYYLINPVHSEDGILKEVILFIGGKNKTKIIQKFYMHTTEDVIQQAKDAAEKHHEKVVLKFLKKHNNKELETTHDTN